MAGRLLLASSRPFSDRITGRIEYRYTDLGEGNFRSVSVNSIDESELTFHALRAGLSVKL